MFPAEPDNRPRMEDDVPGLSSRDISENSNAGFAGGAFRSGFIAWLGQAAKKSFSAQSGRFRRYFGVTPKVAANRFE